MKKKLLSIIVPIYNLENYINRCLNSIFNQTYKEIDIICVDDGSVDGSRFILEQYSKKYKNLKVLFRNHEGSGKARNIGLNYVRTPYLTFLDCDDYYCSNNALKTCINMLLSYDVDLVIFNFKKRAKNISEINNQFYMNNINKSLFTLSDINHQLFQAFSGRPWNKVYKTSLVEQSASRFQEGLYNSEDNLFTFSYISHTKKICLLKKSFVEYTIRCESQERLRRFHPLCFVESLKAIKEKMCLDNLYHLYIKSFFNRIISTTKWNFTMLCEEDRINCLKQLYNFLVDINFFSCKKSTFYNIENYKFYIYMKNQYIYMKYKV